MFLLPLKTFTRLSKSRHNKSTMKGTPNKKVVSGPLMRTFSHFIGMQISSPIFFCPVSVFFLFFLKTPRKSFSLFSLKKKERAESYPFSTFFCFSS